MKNLEKYISFEGYRNDSPDKYNPVNIIPTGRISMKDVNYPVFGIDEYGNGGIMYPGNEYNFPGNAVLEIPMMGSGGQHGGLDRWFAEKWVDVKTGKECGRQKGEKRKGYPACRPSRRVSADTPKTSSELSSSEKAKFKREKTSSKRISYNHKRQEGGEQISINDPRYAELYKNRQVGSWSPEYQAYNLPDLPEFVVTGKDERLKEAMYQGSGRFLQGLAGVMGSPQTGIMDVITGKQQTPSEAWGFDTKDKSWYHPKTISNFAMDTVLDPMNLLGVGLVDDLTKGAVRVGAKQAARRSGNYLTTKTPLKNTYKINPFAVKEPDVILTRTQKPGQTAELRRLDELESKGLDNLDFMERYEYKQILNSPVAKAPGYGRGFSSRLADIDYYSYPNIKDTRGYEGVSEILKIRLPGKEAKKFNVGTNPVKGYTSYAPKREFLLPKDLVYSAESFIPTVPHRDVLAGFRGPGTLSNFVRTADAEQRLANTPDWLRGYPSVANKSFDASKGIKGSMLNEKAEGGELELAQWGLMTPPGLDISAIGSAMYNYFFGDDDPVKANVKKPNQPSPVASMYQNYNRNMSAFNNQIGKNNKINSDISNAINLTSGRFQGAAVPPEIINEAVQSAKEQGIDPWLMLSVIGRESTFGSGTEANQKRAGNKGRLVSGWDVAESYTPYDPLRFLADKKAPGVSVTIDDHGWHYKLDDKTALNKYLTQHPELVAQYQQKIAATPQLGNQDSFDLAAKFIKEKGLKRYNPGDPNYSSMVNQDMQLLKSDPKLKEYMKKLGYENGGELFDMKSGGNVPTNPSLWSRAKSAAKAKYDVYPSAYANGYAAKWYKQRGGGWKKAEMGGCFECGGQFAEGGVNYNDMLNQPVYVPTNFVQFGGVANPLKQIQNMDMGDKIQLAKLAMMFAEDGGEADGGMALTQINAMMQRLNNLKNFITPDADLDPWISDKLSVMNHSATAIDDYMQYGEEGEQEEMKNGGIPSRYKNMGFSKVGVKKESTRPGKKWMVLAKKGDDYKVVHGGYDGMKDFSQHGSDKRKKRFWDRMGGRDSAKAKDPFSPLYWHKRFGTWAEGGEPQNAGFQALPEEVQNKILKRMIGGGEEGDWMTTGKTTNRNIAAYQDKPTRSMVNFGANTTLNPALYAIEGMDDKGFFGDLAAIALGAGALSNIGLGYRKLLSPASKIKVDTNTKTGETITTNLMGRDSEKMMNQYKKPEFYQEPVQDEMRRQGKFNLSFPQDNLEAPYGFEDIAKYGGYYVNRMQIGGEQMLSKDEWMQQNGRGLMGQELQDEKDYQAYVQQWKLENQNATTQQTPESTTTTTPEVTTRLGKSKMIPNLELDPEGQALAYGTISAISTIANRKNRKDTLKEYEANLQKYGNTDFRFDNNYVNRDMFGQYTTNRAQGQNFILNKTTYPQDMGNQFNYGFGTNFKEGGEYDLTPQQIAAIMAAGGEIEFLD